MHLQFGMFRLGILRGAMVMTWLFDVLNGVRERVLTSHAVSPQTRCGAEVDEIKFLWNTKVSIRMTPSPSFLLLIPFNTLGQRHTTAAETIQRAANGQVHLATAELLYLLQIFQVPSSAGVGYWDAAPLCQLLDQLLVDAPLQALVVGRVDEELGAVWFQAFDGL